MKYLVEDTTLTNVANSIRTKEGSTGTIKVGDFASKIANLPTSEDLNTELNAQDTLLENQNTAIADIYDALENKGEITFNAEMVTQLPAWASLPVLIKKMPPIIVDDDVWSLNFSDMRNLEELKVISNPTLQTSNFDQFCYDCRNLKKIDLSEFYAPNLQRMYLGFSSCESLEELDISNLDLTQLEEYTSLFYDCGYRNRFNPDKITKVYVKDKANQDWILNLSSNDRPSNWSTNNVIIKGGN